MRSLKKLILLASWPILLVSGETSGTTLGDLAGVMQPGSWADLSTNGYNSGSILRPPATGSCLEYGDEGFWNPFNNSAMVLGASHPNSGPGLEYGYQCFVRFSESSNAWANLPVPDASGVSGDAAHEYGHSALDTRRGDFYHRIYYSQKIRKFSHVTQTWSQCSPWGNGTFQVAGALEYFPERDSLVFLDGDWGVWELSLASGTCNGTWVQRASTNGGGFTPKLSGLFSYHNQAKYSSRCNCIVMGGGNGSRKLFRYNKDGTFTQATDAPVAVSVPQASMGTIFTTDPVTGNILVWSHTDASSSMYEYNSATDVWSRISRSAPIFPGPEGGVTETYAIPISTYGVIMFTQAGSSSGGRVYLYRHSSGSGTPLTDTAPPTVKIFSPAEGAFVVRLTKAI